MTFGRDEFSRFSIVILLLTIAFAVALALLTTRVIGEPARQPAVYAVIALSVLVYYVLLLVLVRRSWDRVNIETQATRREQMHAQRPPFSLDSSAEAPTPSSLTIRELYFSPRWKSMLGYEPDAIGNTPEEWFGLVHPDDVEQLKATITAHLQGEGSHFSCEHRMRHRDGAYRWVLTRGLAVNDPESGTYRVVGSQSDITEQKRAEEQQLQDSFYDVLTDLPNLALFMEELEQTLLQAAEAPASTYAVLLVDVDRFTSFVTIFGHPAGDEVLKSVGERLADCIRPNDILARLPGDSFAILLNDVGSVEGAQRVAERIQSSFSEPTTVGADSVRVSVSIGIVAGDGRYTEPAAVLRDAHVVLESAKSVDKVGYQVFDPRMRLIDTAEFPLQAKIAWQKLENELRRGIEREEFAVRYQPIVSLASGRITGLEALLRWNHPERGLLAPASFADVANETGIIVPVGEWILRTACRQMRAWHEQFPTDPPLVIVVNLSMQQLMQPSFVNRVDAILAETGLPPSALSLDIVAGDVTDASIDLSEILSDLRSRGIRVHIDDFVIDRAMLEQLQELPVDTIKVDRSFIEKMNRNGRNATVIKNLVTHAHTLGLHVTAEGLETNEQLSYLKTLGVEDAQGFLLSDPLTSETVVPLLAIFSS